MEKVEEQKVFGVQIGSIARNLIEGAMVVILGYMAGQVSAMHTTLNELKGKQIEMQVHLTNLLRDQEKINEMHEGFLSMKTRLDAIENAGR